MANSIGWNPVQAHFNDVNQSMNNVMHGLSNVGTIFGQMRKEILDEEQRAWDNAFKEKEYNERVRQFGLTHGLNERKLDEDVRQFDSRFGLDKDKFNLDYDKWLYQQDRDKILDEQKNRELNREDALAKARMNLLDEQLLTSQTNRKEKQGYREAVTKQYSNLLNDYEDFKEKKAELQAAIDDPTLNSATKEQAKYELALLNENRIGTTASELREELKRRVAGLGFILDDKDDPFKSLAEKEQADKLLSKEQLEKNEKARQQQLQNAYKILDDKNLIADDRNAISRIITQVMWEYPDANPETIAQIAANFYNTTGAWTDFNGRQKFDIPLSEKSYIHNFNLKSDEDNPLKLAILTALKNAPLSNVTGTSKFETTTSSSNSTNSSSNNSNNNNNYEPTDKEIEDMQKQMNEKRKEFSSKHEDLGFLNKPASKEEAKKEIQLERKRAEEKAEKERKEAEKQAEIEANLKEILLTGNAEDFASAVQDLKDKDINFQRRIFGGLDVEEYPELAARIYQAAMQEETKKTRNRIMPIYAGE